MVTTLTFDLLTSESNQFIFVLDCNEVVNFVRFPFFCITFDALQMRLIVMDVVVTITGQCYGEDQGQI